MPVISFLSPSPSYRGVPVLSPMRNFFHPDCKESPLSLPFLSETVITYHF